MHFVVHLLADGVFVYDAVGDVMMIMMMLLLLLLLLLLILTE